MVATLPRYQNINATLELAGSRSFVDANVLVAFSRSDPDLGYVFNSVDGNQGISPIPMKTANSYAVKARADIVRPLRHRPGHPAGVLQHRRRLGRDLRRPA